MGQTGPKVPVRHVRTGTRAGTVASTTDNTAEPVVIKKYANRRLYNTATSSYVTLDVLCQMVKEGEDFVVYDAKTGEDITRSVLTQIIFEEENKGANLLPIGFLRQLIGYYGDRLETLVPSFLEMSMEAFAHNQEEMREKLSSAFDPGAAYRQFETITRQNLSLFEQAMRVFSPFENRAGPKPGAGHDGNRNAEPVKTGEPKDRTDEIEVLKDQLSLMQEQLNALAQKKS